MANMMVLEAAKRDVMGKEVRHLRKAGLIPGVLYGPTIEPIPLQVKWTELRLVLKGAGGSSVIEVAVDGQESHNALIRKVQRHPLRGDVMHVDFYRVRMDVAIRTDVPLVMIGGDDDDLSDKGGVVNQEMTAITVECLPGDLPSEIHIDLSGIVDIGDTILVSALPKIEGVTYLANDDDVVVSSTYLERLAEEGEEEEALFDGSVEPELVRDEDDDFDDEV